MELLDILLGNLAICTALLLLALAVSRFAKRPALVHGICLLFLLKLLTPPLFRVDITLPQLSATSAQEAPAVPEATVPEVAAFEPVAPSLTELAVPDAAARAEDLVIQVLLGLWALGSLLVVVSALVRGLRFKKLVRHAESPPDAITERLAELASAMGIRHPPEPTVIPGKLPPMLWAPLGTAKLLLPKRLVRDLDPRELDCLLVHELAHYRRGDHLVRWIELAALAVHWWNPLVWLARRTLRDAEESCCDAWVLWVLPEHSRDYANSLLSTVDFLADTKVALPPAASGVGTTHNLRRRLKMIMLETTPRRLTRLTRIAVLGCGALLLPALPSIAQDESQHEKHVHEVHKQLAELEAQQHALERFKAEIAKLKHEILALREHGDLAKANALEAKLRKSLEAHKAKLAHKNRDLEEQHARQAAELQRARAIKSDITKLSQQAKQAASQGKLEEAHKLLQKLSQLKTEEFVRQDLTKARHLEQLARIDELRAGKELEKRLGEEATRNAEHARALEMLLQRAYEKKAAKADQNPLARIAEMQKASKELQVLHKTMEVLHAHGLHEAAADLQKAAQAIAKRMHEAEYQRQAADQLDKAKAKLEAARREHNRANTRNTDQSDRIRRLEQRMEDLTDMIRALKAELAKSRRKL